MPFFNQRPAWYCPDIVLEKLQNLSFGFGESSAEIFVLLLDDVFAAFMKQDHFLPVKLLTYQLA